MSTNYEKLVRCSQKQIDIFIQSLVTKEASRYVDWSAWLSSEDPEAPMKGEPAFLFENDEEKQCWLLDEYVENERTYRRAYLIEDSGNVREEAFPVHMVRKATEDYYPDEEEPEEIPEFTMEDIFPEETPAEEPEPEETPAEEPEAEPEPAEEPQPEEEPVTEEAPQPEEEPETEPEAEPETEPEPVEEEPVTEEEPEEVPAEPEPEETEEELELPEPEPEVKAPEIEKTRIYVPGERLWSDDDDDEEEEEETKEPETPEPEPEPEIPFRNSEPDDLDTAALQSLMKELDSRNEAGDYELTDEDTKHIMEIEDALMRSFDEHKEPEKDDDDDTTSGAQIHELLEDLKERSDLYDPEDPEDRELPTIAFTSTVSDKTRF